MKTTPNGKTDYYVDMDTLTPQERTLTLIHSFEYLYAQFLDSWNPRTGSNSPEVKVKLQYMISWLRENMDIEKLAEMIRREQIRYGEDLIEILRG